jgi:SAM-dependent methyltransferase
MVNKVTPRTVVEVGCGLGEIISRVEAPNRAGYDLEQAVIDAARYLRGSRVDFHVGSALNVKEAKIDVLIALNWIHNLSPKEMEEFLEPFYNRVAYFLLEGITPGHSGYRFHHDFSFLDGNAVLIEAAAGGIGEPRTLMLFKVSKNAG